MALSDDKHSVRSNEWDFSNKATAVNSTNNSDVAIHSDRQGPDLFVQNAIPLYAGSAEPIYAEIKKKPASIFQVKILQIRDEQSDLCRPATRILLHACRKSVSIGHSFGSSENIL